MSDWKECKLGDVITLQRGHDLSKSKMMDGSVPVAGSNGIIGYHDVATTNAPGITIGRSGNLGNAFFYKEDFWAHNTTLYVKDFKGNNELFIYYFLKTFDFKQFNVGSAVPTLNRNHIHPLDVLIPPLPEQRAIASVLSSLDDKIDLLHRENQTLEAMAETLFRQWFVEEAKEEWEEGMLGDVIELIYGKGLKKEIRTGTGYPVIGSSGVVGYHSEFLVEGPGIVIGRKGTLGKVIYLWDNFFPIDTTYYIKSKVESIGLLYEYFLLKTLNFEEMNSDSAVPGLNRDIALSTEIKIAPFEKLDRFNQFTSTFIDKMRENKSQIRTLEKLRDTLLPKLMSGDVRIENTERFMEARS
ncbi:putative type-1 restriction enzyme specificity protein MG438 [archaeon BMS3Abin16]|nr:putative type-1 restriction enzyme specificity protein MG438 [archaeon BMS3Abin16]HDL01944.1 restriction endonuclease subunit S [candidate division Zixibacteria bacterium]